jgi:hypothetical protein
MVDSSAQDGSKAKAGCFSRLLSFLLVSGLGVAIYCLSQPQDLSDLEVARSPARDIKAALAEAVRSNKPLTLSEEEINRWLAQELVVKQGGLLAQDVSLDRVSIRLENQRAEVILLRHCFGYPFTVSMYLKIERSLDAEGSLTRILPTGGPYHVDYPYPRIGGRFGKLVLPQGYLHLVLPSYQSLAAEFSEEIELAVVKMWKVRIEPHQITLDPREPLGMQGMPQTL